MPVASSQTDPVSTPLAPHESSRPQFCLLQYVLAGLLLIPCFVQPAFAQPADEIQVDEDVAPAAEQKDDEAKDDEQKEAPKQPLQNLIKNLLGFGKQKAAPNQNERVEEGDKRDSIDQRAPLIREQESLLRRAETRIDRGQWPEAIEILQTLLEEETESVVIGRDGDFRSIRWETQAHIGDLPPQAREMYERTYGPLAERLLRDASAQSDFPTIREVAEKYFHTQAGYEAANRIAAYHLDHGEFAIAARWYRRLEGSDAEFVSDPLWRFKVGQTLQQTAFSDEDVAPWLNLTGDELRELAERLGEQNTLEDTRAQWSRLADLAPLPLKDWLFPGGSRTRAGHAEGTAPLLISQWTHPLSDQADTRKQIEDLLEDLKIEQAPAIPVSQPIVVGNRVAFRTFDGLRVVNVDTGEVYWETHDAVSPEHLLGHEQGSIQPGVPNVVAMQGRVISYSGDQSEKHPLANLLFRNGVHGTLSSDGDNVFLIEQNAVMSASPPGHYYSNFDPSRNDPFRRDWSSNQLSAYDLETGRQLWHVGGSALDEPIDPPLAGTFFFGPPLCDGEELFIIGEQDNALRVFCLEAATGREKWSQLLAYTDVTIERDIARRWWPCPIALSEGVLVCPTNVGFLVGVDRRSREIVWISRYAGESPEQEQQLRFRGGGMMINSASGLGERWFPTPPMIVGQTVVHVPPEEPILTGYRLTDGKELWRIEDLGHGLYPVGRYGSDLIVVTDRGLTGYNLTNGKEAWEVRYSEFDKRTDGESPMPCGRGLIMGNQLLLPINERELWYFDLDTHKFVSRAEVSRDHLRLGNLIMAQGKLVVSSPLEVNFFQPKMEVEQEIRERLADDPNDPLGLMKQAQVHALEHRFEEALAALDTIASDEAAAAQLGPELQKRYRAQKRETLIGLVRDKPTGFDEEFAELATLIDSDEERQLYLRLRADRMLANDDPAGAFEAYAELASFDGSSLVRDTTDPGILIRQDVWLQSRLKRLWENSSGNVSGDISELVSAAVDSALDNNNLDQMVNVVKLYGFHPGIEDLYAPMIDDAIEQRNYPVAQFALDTMKKSGDEAVAATAIAWRSRVLSAFDMPADARHWAQQLSNYDRDLVLLDGYTVGEQIQEQQAILTAPEEYQMESWANEEYELVPLSISTGSSATSTVNMQRSDLPFHRTHRFGFDRQTGRLEVMNRYTDELAWSLPLQQIDQVSQSTIVPIRVQGHLFVGYYRGMVQCYSIPDRRLVWTQTISNQSGVANQFPLGKQRPPRTQQARHASSRIRLNRQDNEFGPLAMFSPSTLCYFGRNELIAVDPIDGQVRWIRRGIARGTVVYGNDEFLCIVPLDARQAKLVRTSDGSEIDSEDLGDLINQGIAVVDDSVITLSSNSVPRILGTGDGEITLSSVNLLTRETTWEMALENENEIAVVADKFLLSIESSGRFRVIDLRNGQINATGTLEEEAWKGQREVHAFLDNDQLYLVMNHSTSHSTYLNVFSQRVNGYLVSLNPHTGEQLWQHKLDPLNLVLEDLYEMPVLVIAGAKHEQKHGLYVGSFKLQLIDKQTGEVLFQDKFTMQQGVQQIEWSTARKQLLFRAYQMIYTLRPKQNVAETAE